MRAAAEKAERLESFEQREFERVVTSLAGKMFVPAEETTIDCGVVDLSAGGAGIVCSEMPPLETFVVLYIDEFGRYEAVVTRVVGGVLGVRFVCSEAKRVRLMHKLARSPSAGTTEASTLRRHKRVRATPISFFTRGSGERVHCEIIDISLTGASLKAEVRPPVGEMVLIGQMAARVVRQHDHGVGLVFATTP
jgi:hypothetical protein